MDTEREGPRTAATGPRDTLLGLILAGDTLDAAALALAKSMDEHDLLCVLHVAERLRTGRPPGGAPVLRGPPVWAARQGTHYHVYAIARQPDGTSTPVHLPPAPCALHAAVLAVDLQRCLQAAVTPEQLQAQVDALVLAGEIAADAETWTLWQQMWAREPAAWREMALYIVMGGGRDLLLALARQCDTVWDCRTPLSAEVCEQVRALLDQRLEQWR